MGKMCSFFVTKIYLNTSSFSRHYLHDQYTSTVYMYLISQIDVSTLSIKKFLLKYMYVNLWIAHCIVFFLYPQVNYNFPIRTFVHIFSLDFVYIWQNIFFFFSLLCIMLVLILTTLWILAVNIKQTSKY